MEQNQFDTLINKLNMINANLLNMINVLKTISNDTEMTKVSLKRMSKQDHSTTVNYPKQNLISKE